MNARRGAAELDRLLREATADVRALDLPGFRRWLDAHLARWRSDEVFALRAAIRDVRRSNHGLRELEAEQRAATTAAAAEPHAARLAEIDRELHSAAKALAGLGEALAAATPDRRDALRQKQERFRARQAALAAEREEFARASPARQALLRIESELTQLRTAVGLDAAETRLADLQRQRGRRSDRAGGAFEALARTVTEQVILLDLAAEPARILTGVMLGAARVEFDQLVVHPAGDSPVEVLAAVEVKRNVNDLAHGFRGRQLDLAWLTGERDRYDPATTRTRAFPTGHFDREAVHREGGEAYRLGPGSFRHFRCDPAAGVFLDRLYFVTRPGPLWGLSSAALAQLAARVATDPRFDPADDGYLAELFAWCRSLTHPVEAPDVLRLYAADPGRAGQIVLADA